MKEIVFVKKSDVSKGLAEEEVVRAFEENVELASIKEAVENSTERLYATWASVDARDNDGEIIPIEDVIAQQEILMKRNGPISDTHTNKIVGRTLAYKVLEHPKSKTLGVLHLEKIYDDNPHDDKVWDEIITEVRTGSSVGGINSSMSLGKDENGKMVKVLEGFSQMETATVERPCNPFATNIAYSVVAKSNSTAKAFAGYENFAACVSANQDKQDPEAYCGSIQSSVEKLDTEECKKVEKQETVINKQESINVSKTNTGDIMENDEIKKSISDLTDVVKGLVSKVTKMEEEKPQDVKPKEEVDKEDAPEEKKPEDKKEEVAKEEAASDIDGETSAPAPKTPVEDQSNDKDVFKTDIADLKKSMTDLTQVVKTMKTPSAPAEVKKSEDSLAHNLASGKVKMNYRDVLKSQQRGN